MNSFRSVYSKKGMAKSKLCQGFGNLKSKPTANPNSMVEAAPPMNPSQVFFGESLISGVFPKKNPNM